jgi:hypothetical protein
LGVAVSGVNDTKLVFVLKERRKERWRMKENEGKRVVEGERNQETNNRKARKWQERRMGVHAETKKTKWVKEEK